MRSATLRRTSASLLAGIAYIACVFQWLWVMMIALPPLVKSGAFDSLMSKGDSAPVIKAAPIVVTPLVGFIIGAVTVAMIVITVYVLLRLPKTITKTGETIVQHTAHAVMPIVTHHKPLLAKKRRLLSMRLKLIIQLTLTIVPLLISLLLPSFQDISKDIIIFIAALLAAVSLAGFVAAWVLTYNLKPTSRTRSHASHGSR